MVLGVRLYRVVGLVVDNVHQYHVVGNRRVYLTRIRVRDIVDCFGPKVNEANQPGERVRALNDPLGCLLANRVGDVRGLTESLARGLVFQVDACFCRAENLERYFDYLERSCQQDCTAQGIDHSTSYSTQRGMVK